jgi:hypothetical protein
MHFYALASRMLRRILVDHAKSQRREKRGGDAPHVSLDEALVFGAETPGGIVELDEALKLLPNMTSARLNSSNVSFSEASPTKKRPEP